VQSATSQIPFLALASTNTHYTLGFIFSASAITPEWGRGVMPSYISSPMPVLSSQLNKMDNNVR